MEPSGTELTGVPSVYSGQIPDLNNPPPFLYMSGSLLGYPGPDFTAPTQIDFKTTFNMTIALNGASGSQPTIDVTGTVNGSLDVTAIPRSSPFWAAGFNLSSSLTVQGTATSATLQGWTPNSGIPISLINQYLNRSIYTFTQTASGMAMALSPELFGESFLGIDLSPAAETPEPATVLLFLATIAALGVRRGAQFWSALQPGIKA